MSYRDATNFNVGGTNNLKDTTKIADWWAITSSSSGQYLAACQSNGYIYTSHDYGVTWTNIGSISLLWHGITSSSSGQYLAVCGITDTVSGTPYNGCIFISNDYGVSWNWRQSTSPNNSWYCVTSSASGQYLVAGAYDVTLGGLWTSSDYGATFAQTSFTNAQWSGITCSSSGQYFAGCVNGGLIYFSSDYGETWGRDNSSSLGSKQWYSITSSSSGQYLAACAYGDYIYTSSDYGASWNAITGGFLGDWNCITYSSSGQYLAVGLGSGNIYTYKKTIDMGEIYGSMIDELQVAQYLPSIIIQSGSYPTGYSYVHGGPFTFIINFPFPSYNAGPIITITLVISNYTVTNYGIPVSAIIVEDLSYFTVSIVAPKDETLGFDMPITINWIAISMQDNPQIY